MRGSILVGSRLVMNPYIIEGGAVDVNSFQVKRVVGEDVENHKIVDTCCMIRPPLGWSLVEGSTPSCSNNIEGSLIKAILLGR